MPTPRSGYFVGGKKVPGTTTIIGRFKESGALIYWAYNRGKEGLELYESRDKAAELGTIVHEMVEEYIRGGHPYDVFPDGIAPEDQGRVMSAFGAFEEWFESNKFQVVGQEMQLTSKTHLYGGTPDAIALDAKGRLCLIDFKTSDGVYSDYLYQLGAYRILWNENNPDNQLTGGSHLARFSKQHGDFSHHFYPDIAEAERGFLLMRSLYEIDGTLKKRAK
jgi:hypothetical protein